jgi:hypothetical protein
MTNSKLSTIENFNNLCSIKERNCKAVGFVYAKDVEPCSIAGFNKLFKNTGAEKAWGKDITEYSCEKNEAKYYVLDNNNLYVVPDTDITECIVTYHIPDSFLVSTFNEHAILSFIEYYIARYLKVDYQRNEGVEFENNCRSYPINFMFNYNNEPYIIKVYYKDKRGYMFHDEGRLRKYCNDNEINLIIFDFSNDVDEVRTSLINVFKLFKINSFDTDDAYKEIMRLLETVFCTGCTQDITPSVIKFILDYDMFKLVGGNCFNSESIFYSWLISNNDIISSLNWYKNLFGNIIDYSKFNIITDAELCETLKIGNLNDNTIKEHKHIINERTNKEEYSIKNMSNDDLDALKSKITELSKKLELRDIEIESLQKKIDVYKEVLSWTD